MAKREMSHPYDTGNVLYNGKPVSDDRILVKFLVFQALALSFAAVHGVFQRLPFMAEWLRESDYGGHLITNLGLTHVNVVAGGTIAIAGITYYVLPRVLQRPMYSRTLCNLSFWFTTLGVMGFYTALWPIGLAEGALVQQGYTYSQAKDIVGFWHKFPEAVSASIMGVGYWLYVTNVVVTIWKSRKEVRNRERFEAKFHLVATISLLLGTLQGVYQVLPWSLDWLYKTGAAGQLIDPASHSHMNLIGGCVLAFMGFMYYFLPRITGHPIFSVRLANFSFWATFIGVYTFWLTFITLGFIEGNMVIRQGITAQAAKEAMGIWHPIPISIAASIMALGLWSFIANVLLTLKMGLGKALEKYIAVFLGISVFCLFVSTTQGIIQIQGSTARWIEQAREGGELVLLVAHPQMNIIGVVSLTLMSLGTYVLPRMVGRRLYSHKLAKFALGQLVFSVFVLYFTTLTLGILEGNLIRQGKSFAQARQEVTGGLHDWILVGLYLSIGFAYFCYAYNIVRTVGAAKFAEGWHEFNNSLSRMWGRVLNVNLPAPSREKAVREAVARLGIENSDKLANSRKPPLILVPLILMRRIAGLPIVVCRVKSSSMSLHPSAS
jgi:heme/copper-type cytochrome/quinol oxidase subunit 1